MTATIGFLAAGITLPVLSVLLLWWNSRARAAHVGPWVVIFARDGRKPLVGAILFCLLLAAVPLTGFTDVEQEK